MDLVRHALKLLEEFPEYVDDARAGAHIGNSIIGSVMNFTHGIPRTYAEQAVASAIAILDADKNGGSLWDEPPSVNGQ